MHCFTWLHVAHSLDPWMYPLSPHHFKRGIAHTPVLALFGDRFVRWTQNIGHTKNLLLPGNTQGVEETERLAYWRAKHADTAVAAPGTHPDTLVR